MPDSHDPSIGDPIAALDQALASTGALAVLLAGYHRELVTAGFSPTDALSLVVAYQGVLMRPEPNA